MSATPKNDLFERFKRLYGSASEPVRQIAADNRQPVPGVKQDNPVETAEKALELLARLKGYTLPSGRMPVVRALAEQLEAFKNAAPETILRKLESFEAQLIALGGAYDPELAEVIGLVNDAFPGSRLVEVRKLQ